jgi:hypothetical protein
LYSWKSTVTDYSATNWVGEYNAATGAAINAQFIITNPDGAYGVALSGNHLFVAGYQQGTVSEYDATTGAVINANFITGILYPLGLAVVGNTLYVAQDIGDNPGVVSTYDATRRLSQQPPGNSRDCGSEPADIVGRANPRKARGYCNITG